MFSRSRHYAFFFATLFVVFAPVAHADATDPPGRAARLSYTQGPTSFSPAGEDEWVDAVVNRPLISGDRLWADDGGRAEVEVGSSALRIGANTSFEFVNLDDRTTQVEVTEGTLGVSLRHYNPDEVFEIDTPTLAITLADNGRYRVEVDPDGAHTTIAVMRGSATARGDRAEYPLQAGDRIRFGGTDLRDAEQLDAFADDDFARFCAARDNRAEHAASLQYVAADVVGAYDLDEYGSWSSHGDYGNVWYPSHVDADWAPYRDGHWIWQDPWGWTWVDNAPWGFAPAHYGRWVSIDHRWGWVPGPRQDRAVYAPALVVFIGGGGFSVGISAGGGGPIGWFPLGAREIYAPPYHASRDYFTRVNVTNTTINTVNITNVYNDYSSGRPLVQASYANRTVAGAVTAVPRNVFAGAQPVRAAAIKVDDKALAGASISRIAAVAPTARSVAGNTTVARAKPAPAVFERKVVVQTPPPPKPAPFAARQAELQRTPGQPLPPPAVAAARTPAGAPARNVRVLAPAANAVNVRATAPAKPATAAAPKPAPETRAPPTPPGRALPTPPERGAAPAAQERARRTPPPQQERATPPAAEQPRAEPAPQERGAAAAQERARRTPPPQQQQQRATPPAPEQPRTEPAPQERSAAAAQERARRTPPPQQQQQQQRATPPAPEQPRTEPAPQERSAAAAQERARRTPPPQQERAAAPATDQPRAAPQERARPTPPAQEQRNAPPAAPPQRAAPAPQERTVPPTEPKPRSVPPVPPEQQRKAPPKKDKNTDKKDDGSDADKKDGGGGNMPPGNPMHEQH